MKDLIRIRDQFCVSYTNISSMIHFDCGHIYKWNCETRWSDGDQMRTALIVSGGLDTCVTCGFFIYSGCVSRPVAVHQLHGHTV